MWILDRYPDNDGDYEPNQLPLGNAGSVNAPSAEHAMGSVGKRDDTGS